MVAIIGNSILNGIDQHGLPNKSYKVRVKNHPGATTGSMRPFKAKNPKET